MALSRSDKMLQIKENPPEDRKMKFLYRDLYVPPRETFKDMLFECQKECKELSLRASGLEAENAQLKTTIKTLEGQLQSLISERDLALTEKEEGMTQHFQLSVNKTNDDLAMLLATSKMQQAQLKSEIENLRDELTTTSEIVRMRDREISHLNRETEKILKQNILLFDKLNPKSGKTISKTSIPIRPRQTIRQMTIVERGGIRPFPGVFDLGKSVFGDSTMSAMDATEKRVPIL